MRTSFAKVNPACIVSCEIDTDNVRMELASGRILVWKRRGFTIVGKSVVNELEAHASDLLSAQGVNLPLRDNKGADWVGYVECLVCHEWHKGSVECDCGAKADQRRKTLEAVKHD